MSLDTNTTWYQPYYLFGSGLGVSTIIAAIPIFTLLYLLGVKRKPAWLASTAGLGAALVVAAGAYQMPVGTAVSAAASGAAFGVFPISWIVFWAIALYRVTVETGKFEIVKQSLGSFTSDPRLQALLIAFAFGAFIEGAAGFGTPVAVAGAMLTGLGFPPFRAAAICLLANTAPVAFGSIGIPVVTLAGVTGLPVDQLSAAVGRICAPVSLVIPAYLTAAITGWSSLREVWPAALTAGGSFALVQFLASNYMGPQLTDILSSLAAIASLVVLLRCWSPVRVEDSRFQEGLVATAARAGSRVATGVKQGSSHGRGEDELQSEAQPACSRRDLLAAWMPYGLLVLFVLLWGWKPMQTWLDLFTITFPWPKLHNVVRRMPPITEGPVPYAALFKLNWLSASGTACMFATVLSALLLKMQPRAFGRLVATVARQLLIPTLTVTSVLGMAFLMNYCGATGTLGLGAAATGRLFPFFSPLLGWLGVFLTGSDTSANALFGSLQAVTAGRLGFDPVLLSAGNSSGGVMGKMISLQTIAVAAAATSMSEEDQARLFRFTLRHSLFLATLVASLVLLYAYRPSSG